ncbi:beta strand repeat-containing protein [Blastomonas sp.]|uniref:beta strand repeat-containing protein n=1 Tax=Blastomonas sp. TaxID=1909299 RepID=UPI00406A1954
MAYDRTLTARRVLLARATSALALATGLAIGSTGPAHAQAFEGTPTVVSGGVGINRTPGTDNIRVDTNQAVINWTTNDTAIGGGVINFLPNGRTAFFRNNPTTQNQFTVLNRIIPTDPSRAIAMNGTIISQLQTGAGLVSGGNVWFYSPGGIVIGATGVIDVGGLVLTSLDPVRDAGGNFVTAGGSFTLGPAASATSYVQVDPGAQIRLTPENSYVAMVAPIIRQNGGVNVNGTAAYVAAEAATLTFGGGLFDIQVTTGTNGDAAAGNAAIVHNGSTTGPASSAAGDNHRIYMVAIPKNNAITTVIGAGSTLGFDIAGAADVQGNSIILSSGFNVSGDTINVAPVNPAQQASLSISSGTITSAINAASSFRTNVSVGSGTLNLAGDARFHADNQVTVTAFGTGTIAAARNLTVSADRVGLVDGQSVTGGNAQLYAQAGGTVRVLGNAFVTANGEGAGNLSGQVGAGTGGTADVRSFGNALMDIAGALFVSADGRAGSTGSTGTTSNSGTGGTVIVTSGRNATVDNNSTMLIGGDLVVSANGFGSSNFGAGVAGLGRGGSIQINSGSGTGIASANNVMTINGLIFSNADGFGGQALNSGTGGAGIGGTNTISAGVGGRINVAGSASLTSFGFGGHADDGNGNGGNGTGGSAFAQIFGSGGILSFGSNLVLQATGSGGSSGNDATSTGGTGRGGNATLALGSGQAGGAITVQGLTQIDALGLGGDGTIGGDGFGGVNGSGGGAFVSGQGAGTMTLNGGLLMSAGGVGGFARQAGVGRTGNGTGGSAQMIANGNSIINVTGDVDINANGAVFTSLAAGIDGGNGTGGNASISQNTGGQITITGNAFVAATGTGHDNNGGGDGIAGNGVGGDVRIAVNDRTITITGNATTDARGYGGNSAGGIRGGNGTGGLANLGAGAGTLSIGGNGTTNADGFGGSAIGAGSGGIGTGGRAVIGSIVGGIIQIAGGAELTAQGFGGNASNAGNVGGLGDGGEAQLFADNNGSVTVGGITTLNASAFGGSSAGGADTGAALGGLASLLTLGNGQVALNQDTFLSTQALSGNADSDGGNIGTATGGDSFINAFGAGSRIRIGGSLFADAIAGAGSSTTGTIGNATGGTARIDSASGIVDITGSASLDASAFGGNSVTSGNGGNATGGRTAVVVAGAGGASINIGSALTMVSNAFGGSAQAGNGGNATGGLTEGGTIGVIGSFAFGGNVTMAADGTGGSSLLAGAGGSGTGGTARMGSNGTQMIGRDIFIQANGRGGNGASGGAGGNATGGLASLFAGSGPVTGLLDFDNAFLTANAFGGAGGTGTTGATGGTGGAGGNATGGRVIATSAAGNGQLDLLNLQIASTAFGGAGGAGGIGTAGVGGTGGAGGNAVGGFNQFGSESGTGALTVNVGTTRLVDAVSETNGFGGAGGAGGAGSTGTGNGGAGGIGEGGDNVLLVRGSLVAMNNATLIANGQGGNGGAGAVLGAGGNGIGGGIAFAITDRFQIPANRGRLQANDLLGIARGLAGTGSTAGQTFYGTGSNIEIRNADAAVNSLVINTSGAAPDPVGIVEDFVRVTDGALTVAGSLTYITPGQLSVLVNNGSVNAGAFGVRAGVFVPDTVVTAPANVGTITAGAIDLQSSGNITVTANFATPGSLTALGTGAINLRNINAGGVIGIQGASLQLGNLTSGNHVNLTSTSGAIVAGTITAANFVAMTAANGLTLSAVTATNGEIDLLVNAGNMTIGNLTAGTSIELDTRSGNMVLGDIRSGQDTEMEAVGSVRFGNAVTGLEFAITALGSITGGNVNASGAVPTTSYSVGLLSQTGSIQVGNLTGTRNIGFIAAGTISTGALTSGENILVLGSGDILFNGAVTTGTGANRYLYVGNASMVPQLGANFDPTPIFALAPVRTAGGLTVAGPIVTGNIRAGVGTAAAINGTATATGGSIAITANSLAAQAMNASLAVALNTTSGNLSVGNIVATGIPTAGAIVLTSSGTIAAGTLATGTTAGLGVTVDGQGAVSIGGVTATGAAQLRSRSASFTSTGSITAASVSISGTAATLANVNSNVAGITIGATGGNLAFGALNSATNTQFNVTGSVTGGDITAGTSIGTIVTGNMTLGNLRTTAAGTTSTGFSIGLGAGGTITTGTINSFGLLGIGSDDGQGNFGNATSITTGAITAGGTVLARANQGIVTGAISSTNEIRVRGGSVTTGALQATNAVFAAALNGNLNTGNVTTGTNALLLASQGISTGSIGTGTSGTTLLASSAGLAPTANLSQIDLNALLAATPARVGGSVSIGATTTGTLLGASTGTFSANSTITAGTRISLDVGGTAVFGGLAVAPTIAISSGDIAFSQAGGLGNANTGTITLTANRSGSVVLGGTTSDSQSSGTYALDGSEISRIRAQNIVINAPNVSSTGTGVEIRALTMNGSSASSGVNLNGAEGSLTINTSGTIRVNGNAVFNSMAATNRVSLNANRVEINADSGGLFLNGSSPGGILSINANNIHIASASLLERLAENVNFTGRDNALGLPIATSRPDGVIQASSLRFTVGSTLLIQNTGTSLLNAGFFGRVGSFQVTPRSSQSQGTPSLIDLVIYGQLLDTGDLVRNGTSVRDLIFPRSTSSSGQDSGGPSGFTSTSSVNGCLLSAISCGGGGITEQGPTVVVHAGPPPPKPAAEREQKQEQEEAEAAAEEAARGEAAPRRPIMPPVTIVNTRRLGVEPIIDEPVTSGGNPNLQLDVPLNETVPETGGQP